MRTGSRQAWQPEASVALARGVDRAELPIMARAVLMTDHDVQNRCHTDGAPFSGYGRGLPAVGGAVSAAPYTLGLPKWRGRPVPAACGYLILCWLPL